LGEKGGVYNPLFGGGIFFKRGGVFLGGGKNFGPPKYKGPPLLKGGGGATKKGAKEKAPQKHIWGEGRYKAPFCGKKKGALERASS